MNCFNGQGQLDSNHSDWQHCTIRSTFFCPGEMDGRVGSPKRIKTCDKDQFSQTLSEQNDKHWPREQRSGQEGKTKLVGSFPALHSCSRRWRTDPYINGRTICTSVRPKTRTRPDCGRRRGHRISSALKTLRRARRLQIQQGSPIPIKSPSLKL
jgi:hypothetical protein